MNFFKKAFDSLEISIAHCCLKYLIFWVFVCLLFWFFLWQAGSLLAAYTEKQILKEILQSRRYAYYSSGSGYRTVYSHLADSHSADGHSADGSDGRPSPVFSDRSDGSDHITGSDYVEEK